MNPTPASLSRLSVVRGPKLPHGPVALEAGYMIEEEPTISGGFLPFPVPLRGAGLLEKFDGRVEGLLRSLGRFHAAQE